MVKYDLKYGGADDSRFGLVCVHGGFRPGVGLVCVCVCGGSGLGLGCVVCVCVCVSCLG